MLLNNNSKEPYIYLLPVVNEIFVLACCYVTLVSHIFIWRKSIPSRGHSQWQAPKRNEAWHVQWIAKSSMWSIWPDRLTERERSQTQWWERKQALLCRSQSSPWALLWVKWGAIVRSETWHDLTYVLYNGKGHSGCWF